MDILVILKYAAMVACGFGGSILYALIKGARQPSVPLTDLPPEIRAQIDGCRNCNLSQVVCSEHPRKPWEECDCGSMPTPCPVCKPHAYDTLELLEQIAALKARTW